MSEISRGGYGSVYVVDSESAAQVIGFEHNTGGSIQTADALTVNIYGCNAEDPTGLTFVKLYTDEGEEAKIVATGAGVWPFPVCVFDTLFIKLVGTQTTVKLCIKS